MMFTFVQKTVIGLIFFDNSNAIKYNEMWSIRFDVSNVDVIRRV